MGSNKSDPKLTTRRQFVLNLATVSGGLVASASTPFYDSLLKTIATERQDVDPNYLNDLQRQKMNQDLMIEAEKSESQGILIAQKCGADPKCMGGCDYISGEGNKCTEAKI